MSLGINKPDETYFLEVKLMDNEVLRVTQDGQFIWHPDADRMIEEGDYSTSPAMPHILRVLRKREWVGLTDEEIEPIAETVAQPKQEQGEPVGWMSNKDFEPIRIRIMQEAYELADNNDPEGYNAIKVMCGDVQKMLSPQRTWAGLTDEEIEKVWRGVRANEYHSCVEPFAKDIEAKLKEKNT